MYIYLGDEAMPMDISCINKMSTLSAALNPDINIINMLQCNSILLSLHFQFTKCILSSTVGRFYKTFNNFLVLSRSPQDLLLLFRVRDTLAGELILSKMFCLLIGIDSKMTKLPLKQANNFWFTGKQQGFTGSKIKCLPYKNCKKLFHMYSFSLSKKGHKQLNAHFTVLPYCNIIYHISRRLFCPLWLSWHHVAQSELNLASLSMKQWAARIILNL